MTHCQVLATTDNKITHTTTPVSNIMLSTGFNCVCARAHTVRNTAEQHVFPYESNVKCRSGKKC
jgi:hypothetical protein